MSCSPYLPATTSRTAAATSITDCTAGSSDDALSASSEAMHARYSEATLSRRSKSCCDSYGTIWSNSSSGSMGDDIAARYTASGRRGIGRTNRSSVTHALHTSPDKRPQTSRSVHLRNRSPVGIRQLVTNDERHCRRFTRQGSLVRVQYRPLKIARGTVHRGGPCCVATLERLLRPTLVKHSGAITRRAFFRTARHRRLVADFSHTLQRSLLVGCFIREKSLGL